MPAVERVGIQNHGQWIAAESCIGENVEGMKAVAHGSGKEGWEPLGLSKIRLQLCYRTLRSNRLPETNE